MAIYKELTEAEVNEILFNSSNHKAGKESICYFSEEKAEYVFLTSEEIKECQNNK